MAEFTEIDVNKIRLSDTANVRKTDVELKISELAKSIEEHGLLQPIVVRRVGSEYELIAGQRRLVAVTRLGSTKVPAMIVDVSDDNTCLLLSLLENVQRVDIDDRDRAMAIERLVDANNGDYGVVAKMLGMNEQTIRTWSGYHGVPEELKIMKDKGEIKREEAIRLTHLLGPNKAVEVAKEIRQFPKEQRKKVFRGLKTYTLLEPEEVIAIAKRPPKEKHVTLRFVASIWIALERAAADRGETPLHTIEYIVREWLESRNYIAR